MQLVNRNAELLRNAVAPPPPRCAYFRTPRVIAPFTFPEVSEGAYGIDHIKSKPSLGLALSGGGFRAATCASGWMRGLHKTQLPLDPDYPAAGQCSSVLSKAKYLASTSGGSWFNAAYSFKGESKPLDLLQNIDGKVPTWLLPAKHGDPVDEFFGSFIPPSELRLDLLRLKPDGRFDAAVADSNTLDRVLGLLTEEAAIETARKLLGRTGLVGWAAELIQRRPRWVHTWTQAITETFLSPFGLDKYDSTISADGTPGDFAKSRAINNGNNSVLLACSDPGRPFPILMGSAFNSEGDADGLTIYPFEFTPLYFGTPSAFPGCCPPLGGGYVEPWGLHAEPVELPDTGEVELKRFDFKTDKQRTMHTVPLAQAVSISSSFMAAAAHEKSELVQELCSTEKLVNWGPASVHTEPKWRVMGFADGGTVDNLGISALLRRGVKAVIIMSAASAPPDDTWERYAAEASDVACWFGAAKSCYTPGISATELNDQCRVFAANRLEGERLFIELFDDVHKKLRVGRPGFHRAHYTVHENEYHNIPADPEGVEVLWIFNHQWADWEHSLPEATQKQLLQDRKGPDGKGKGVHHKTVMSRKLPEPVEQLRLGINHPRRFMKQEGLYRFPYFTTFSLNFSPLATNMLSQLSSAVILDAEVQHHIKELVQIASA